jgi:hypothetical protein
MGEQAQYQIIIFGPAALTVWAGGQDIATDHEGGMGDGAFDKGLFAHATGRIDAIQPVFIGPAPVLQVAPRKDANVASHGR